MTNSFATKYQAILDKVPDIGRIGICGAHRTGKTTLGRALSEKLGLQFVEIGTSVIFAKANINPSLPMDFRTRLFIQQQILTQAVGIWHEMDEPFICDRTPIDMMAYTLAEVRGDTLDLHTEQELENYLTLCRLATENHFDKLVLIPPAIPIIDAIGKASPSRGYIEHIHMLCLGLFHELHVTGYMVDRDDKELSARVADVVRFLNV